MEEDKIITTASELISEHFLVKISDVQNENMLREKLKEIIANLIKYNFERLVQGLYRIDVAEEKFSEAMKESDFDLLVHKITNLILNREIEKAKYRNRKM